MQRSEPGFQVHLLICASLLLPISSSGESDEAYVRLNNATLPLKSFLRDYCSKDSCLENRRCNASVPSFFCGKMTSGTRMCLQWCIGEEGTCSDVEECCGNEFECIGQICRSANLRIDFVIIAKVALAMALIITIFAVFTLCWKGIIEPRCTSYSSHVADDSASVTSSERCVREQSGRGCSGCEFHGEKPPPYDECVRQTCAACTSQEDPPPYSIAVRVNQAPVDSIPDPPARYFIPQSSGPVPLGVAHVKVQDVPYENITEVIISSPITNMDDFVCYSAPETPTSSSSPESNDLDSVAEKPEDLCPSGPEEAASPEPPTGKQNQSRGV